MLRLVSVLVLLVFTAGCVQTPIIVGQPAPAPSSQPAPTPQVTRSPSLAAREFVEVVDRVMPVARSTCARQTRGVRCDYAIVVDDRPGLPPNAFQTLGRDGQPIIGFTLPLILEAANRDELAFILSHEAAHHIEGHIARGRVNAQTGAVLAGALVALGGGNASAVQRAQNAGAFYGARRYAQSFELEADALGARIAQAAGYDAINGVAFFQRAPDPGNRFLGTHPPNAQRIDTVRRVVSGG